MTVEPLHLGSSARKPATLSTTKVATGFDWPLVLIGFAVIAAIAIAKAIMTGTTVPLINDTDDAMRLNTVRDLLAGQNWLDHLQHRLNVPYGAEIHWSHIIDAAIGGVILLLRPFAGAMTETLAVYVWPLLLLLALLILTARLAFRLAGRAAILPAVVLPLVSPALLAEFSPGRIDHHSLQILLELLMAWGAIETITRPRFALLAGLAAALSLEVGIEGLPGIVCAVLAVALTWVVRPERAAALRWFGLSFGLGTVVLLAQHYPPARWFQPACDEISIVYAAFAVGVGAALVLLSLLPLGGRPAWQRVAAGGIVGALVAVGLAAAFPLCLKGPYAALDPWLVHNWLDTIVEAKPIWVSLSASPAFTAGVALPPLLGLIAIGWRVWRGAAAGRGEWLVLGLFLLVADLVMGEEIRGARLAAPLAIPAAAWLIGAARERYLAGRRLSGALAILGSWLGFSGLVVAVAVLLLGAPFSAPTKAEAAPDPAQCLMPQAFAELARLPPARVLTPVDLGSHLLLYTPHSVVAAPYHRDQAGVLDTYRFLNGPIGAARQILDARGVTLVVICPGMPEMRGLPDAAPDSFVKLFAQGKLPSWLSLASAPGAALTVFRVLPQ